jgi:opacity protein-like surface antigen
LIGRLALALSFLLGGTSILFGQAIPAASRTADAQIGIGYSLAKPDYDPNRFKGYAAYADFDFNLHLGLEAEIHQVFSPNADKSYQRSYDAGFRYFRTFGPVVPYVKAMAGRGDFNYPRSQTQLGYTLYAGGVGADVKLGRYLRVRGEYEYQKWTGFTNGSVSPQIVTVGVAYHFAGKPGYN